MDAARKAIEDNVPVSAAGGGRFWELLGGITRCGGCGLRMQAHAVTNPVGRVYHYMRCPFHLRTTPERCPVNARVPAEKAEEAVWRFVTRLLVQPEAMVAGVEDLIAAERERLKSDPEREIRGLRRQLSDLEARRQRLQDAYLGGAFTLEELRVRRQEEEVILREIDATENRGERLSRLVDLRDRLQQRAAIWNRLLDEDPDLPQNVIGYMPWENDAFARAQSRALENATPEQRQSHYKELELRVTVRGKGELEVSGIFGTQMIYMGDPSPRPRPTVTTSS